MVVRIEKQDEYIHIIFPYSPDIVQMVRELPRRRYIPENHHWTVPIFNYKDVLSFANELKNQKIEVIIDDKIKNIENTIKSNIKKSFSSSNPDLEIPAPKGLEYFPFQKSGINWINEKKNVLIGDAMGLGKTIQAIGFLNLHPENRPVLIICPATMKYKWLDELKKWLVKKENIYVIKNGNDKIPEKVSIVIINYALVFKQKENLSKKKFQVIVMDESHYIKNKKSQRGSSVLSLAKSIPIKIAMTGTPILNRPIELFNVLRLLNPNVFNDWYWYVTTFCNGYRDKWGWRVNGASNLHQLNDLLRSTVMIRRKKEDVLSELPDKTRTFVPLKVKISSEYKKLNKVVKKQIKDYKKINIKNNEDALNKYKEQIKKSRHIIFENIEKMRKEIFNMKKDLTLEFILNVLENKNKIVVFTYHRDSYFYLKNELEKLGIKTTGIIGGISSKEKNEIVTKFQNDDSIKVFIGSIRACAEGITLTKADTVIFTELDWTPSKLAQAEDRLHRIGQKNAVNVYYLLAEDSIDITMSNIIENKMKIINTAIDGIEKTAKENISMFDELLTIFE